MLPFKFRIDDALLNVVLLVAPSSTTAPSDAAACLVQQLLVSTAMTQPTSLYPDAIAWSANRAGSFLAQGLGVLPASINTSRLHLTIFHTALTCACARVKLLRVNFS